MFKFLIWFIMWVFILKNSLALNDEQRTILQKKLIDFGVECIVEHPLSTDDIEAFKNHTFPDGGNAGCFVTCVFNKSGILDDEGKISQTTVIEKAKTIFDDEAELKNLEDFISACTKVNNENVNYSEQGCDRAKLAYNCLIENSEQFGFDIDF